MSDEIGRPFMFILSFIVASGFLIGMFAPYIISGSTIDENNLPDVATSVGDLTYQFYEPLDGYEISNTSVKDHKIYPSDSPLAFDDPADKWVQIIRNNTDYRSGSTNELKKYKDYIVVERNTGTPKSVTSKWRRTVLPLEKFVLNFDNERNLSQVSFSLTGKNYTLFLSLPNNDTNNIWWNNYTLYLGASYIQKGSINFWSAIGMIMFANIPNCNEYLAYLIAVVFDFGMIYVVFVLVRSIIPFLGG